MQKVEDSVEIHAYQKEFFEFLNPKMSYDILYYINWEKLNKIDMFTHASEAQIMFLAQNMKTQLSIAEENVIT